LIDKGLAMRIQPFTQAPVLAASATRPGQTITVDQFETKKALFPDILDSGGLGPCIAVAIYDPVTRSGYMAHSPSFDNDEILETLIQRVQEDYGDLSSLRILAFGGAIDTGIFLPDQIQGVKRCRVYVDDILKKHFSAPQIQIKWAANYMIASLILDTSKGRFITEETPFELMLDD